MSNETWLDMNGPAVIERIRQEAEQGPVIMEHFRPYSGGAPWFEAFLTLQDFFDFDERILTSLNSNRHQSEYVFWSVANLYKQGQVLFQAVYDDEKKKLFSEEGLKEIENYLRANPAGIQILTLWRGGNVSAKPALNLTERSDMNEFLEEIVSELPESGDEIYIFPNIRDEYKFVLLRAKR